MGYSRQWVRPGNFDKPTGRRWRSTAAVEVTASLLRPKWRFGAELPAVIKIHFLLVIESYLQHYSMVRLCNFAGGKQR